MFLENCAGELCHKIHASAKGPRECGRGKNVGAHHLIAVLTAQKVVRHVGCVVRMREYGNEYALAHYIGLGLTLLRLIRCD